MWVGSCESNPPSVHVAGDKVPGKFTWKCLKSCCRSFLKILSKVIGYEEIVYITLVREEVRVVRTNWRILVVLGLLESASAPLPNHQFHDLQAAGKYSGLGRR